MKKFIAVSLILLMILFVGCEQNAKVGELPVLDSEKLKELGIDNNMCVEVKLTGFSIYEEFENYIKEQTVEGNVPDNFCSYDKLKEIGDFKGITFFGPEGYLDSYMYKLTKKDEAELILYVYHTDNYTKANYTSLPEKYIPEDVTDMRKLGSDEELKGTYSYVYNNIRYIYINGEIYSIKWYSNGAYFVFVPDELSETDMTSNTFQSKLLNLETAEQAIKDIFGEIQPIEEFYATAPTNANETADTDNIEDTFCR